MNEFFHAAETFVILSGSLAILTIFIYKLIRHEAGRDRPHHGHPEKNSTLHPPVIMIIDGNAELRATLRFAMTMIRKMKAHQPVNTSEVLRILARTLKDAKEERGVPRRVRVRL